MERRVSALTILAITSLCACLGLFESAAGVLTLTPFLLLVLPLLAGFDPAAPVAGKLIGILEHRRRATAARPALPAAETGLLGPGRVAARSLRPRGPPAATFS